MTNLATARKANMGPESQNGNSHAHQLDESPPYSDPQEVFLSLNEEGVIVEATGTLGIMSPELLVGMPLVKLSTAGTTLIEAIREAWASPRLVHCLAALSVGGQVGAKLTLWKPSESDVVIVSCETFPLGFLALSHREEQAIRYTAWGSPPRHIGGLLGITPGTVRTYLARATTKVGLCLHEDVVYATRRFFGNEPIVDRERRKGGA